MAKAKYSYRYEQIDFGTERTLTVIEKATGREIGSRDPFWNGVKVGRLARRRQMCKVAREIIRAYEAAQ